MTSFADTVPVRAQGNSGHVEDHNAIRSELIRVGSQGDQLVGPASAALAGRVPISSYGSVSTFNSNPNPTAGTSDTFFPIVKDATDLVLVFCGWRSNGVSDADIAAAVPITVRVYYNGNWYNVLADGSAAISINPGQSTFTDKLPLDLEAGTWLAVRVNTTATGYYCNRVATIPGTGGFTAGDISLAPATPKNNTNSAVAVPLLAPAIILGSAADPRGAVAPGDSFEHFGQGDGPNGGGVNTVDDRLGGGGYLQRALREAGIGIVQLSVPSDSQQSWNNAGIPGNSGRRQSLLYLGTTMWNGFGSNDWNVNRTLAQLQADWIVGWNKGFRRRQRVFQPTIPPRSKSSDGFKTLGNQVLAWDDSSGAGGLTPAQKEANRIAGNAWLRDGAPMIGGVAVAVGTAGAARANYFVNGELDTPGSGVHPLYGVYEVADVVESARDSGKWKIADNQRTVADAAMTSGQQTLTSATAAFSNAADLGRQVTVAGAGAAGALLVATIQAVASATSVTLNSAAGTTVAAAALMVADSYAATDGVHPRGYADALIVPSVPVAYSA
jgi:hypothetical protein